MWPLNVGADLHTAFKPSHNEFLFRLPKNSQHVMRPLNRKNVRAWITSFSLYTHTSRRNIPALTAHVICDFPVT
jgi:hypothetical protein